MQTDGVNKGSKSPIKCGRDDPGPKLKNHKKADLDHLLGFIWEKKEKGLNLHRKEFTGRICVNRTGHVWNVFQSVSVTRWGGVTYSESIR